ncbi:transcription elongation factor TFIIS [Rhodotorula toruloides]
MATAQSILALRKQLIAATGESQNTEDAVIILKRLKEEVVATDELLRETKIGVTVNKLRNNTAKEVADLAKELVRKWKADVGKTGTKKTSTAAASTSNSTAASPSPGPSPIPAAKSPEPGRGPLPAITTASSAKPAASPAPESQSPAPSTSSAPNGPLRRQSSGGPPRTHKTDGIEFGKGKDATGDKTREKCCELIYDALAQDTGAPSDLILSRARALENHVWEENPPPAGSATYRNKMRSFYLNLKAANNPGLREGIVSGEISIVQLYNMDPKDMASEERKAENRKLVAENLFKAQAAAPQQAETDAFQCGKCKQRRCMYYQMQTRSADEPMTTFVTCLSCNNRWKFS